MYMVWRKSLLAIASMSLMVGLLVGCGSSKSEGALKGDLVVSGDTLLSHVCVAQSRYYPGDRIIFRALVTDSSDGTLVEDAAVKLVFDNGEEMEMLLGVHGQEATELWSVGYDVPENAATGTLNYKVVAEYDGKKTEFEPYNVSLSKLTIVDPDTPIGGPAALEALQAGS